MRRFIFLVSEDSLNLSKLLFSLNGVEKVDKALINIVDDKEIECLRVVYESSILSINKLLKYYVGNTENSIVYSKNQDGFLNKAALKYENEIIFSDYTSVLELEDLEVVRGDDRVENYDLYEEPYSIKMSNQLYFIIMFIIGLVLILLGDIIYLIPMIAKIGATEYIKGYYEYYGFTALAIKVLLVGLSFIIGKKIYKRDLIDFKKNILKYLIVIVLSFGLVFASNYLFEFIYSKSGISENSENEEMIMSILNGKSYLPFMFSIIIFTPIFEELVFRKFAFSSCKYLKFPKWLAILAVTFMFAIIHCTSEDFSSLAAYIHLLHYFSLSLFITLPYAICNENLMVSTGIHFLNNLYSSFF